ncbi:MAG: UDP-glucose 4-epimerase GalE [Alphaproteobacteria bacterium]|nr:UDP-glucose 4-epimerase GalE [Alphaproteobacteria bacterium]
MTSRRILVTGGAGYVGSHACKALAQAGHVPVTFDNLSRGFRDAVRFGPFVEGDLGNKLAVERAVREHRVEAVMHFAAYAYVGESMQRPAEYFRNNVSNTLNLLEVMNDVGVGTIVFSSTCSTYGIPETLPILETAPQRPINPYGESKLVVERMLEWQGRAYGLRWAALRYFNAAGADPGGEVGENHDPETHLIPLAIQAAFGERDALELFGSDYPTADGTAVRDYIHVSDLADAHVRALDHLLSGGESLALNLATGRGHSVKEVIAAVERGSGRPVPVRFAPRRPGDPPTLIADPRRAQCVLGWLPRHSAIDTIVATAVAWHTRAFSPTPVRAVAGRG